MFKMVSIIVPCRNEEKFIATCLESLVNQDYPKDKLEIIVVDGMSEDKTRDIVKEYIKKYPFIKLLSNEKKKTVYAFNIGIKNAKGEYVTILNAHGSYSFDRIKKSVVYLEQYQVDAVGGRSKALPRKNTILGRFIAQALSSPFGVGSSFRIQSDKVRYADTASGCLYKKNVFDRIGLFNEKLIYSQDIEFNKRLINSGGKILLAPDIITNYYARADFKSFCKHNFRNGLWIMLPLKYTNIIFFSWRHLVPLVFLLSLTILLVLSSFSSFFTWCVLFVSGLYLLTNLYFSFKIALQQKDVRYFFVMPLIFITLHIIYGIGSLVGFFNVLFSTQFWRNIKKVLS